MLAVHYSSVCFSCHVSNYLMNFQLINKDLELISRDMCILKLSYKMIPPNYGQIFNFI